MQETGLFDDVYEAPVGWLGIRLQGERLSELDWIESPRQSARLRRSRPIVKTTYAWLDSYFTTATSPIIPALTPAGTPFQQRVRRALLTIPLGAVKTYGQLAAGLNTSSRAIGQACRSNPIAIIIPCHRVVAAVGIGGYMGATGHIYIKRWLLEHEGAC